MRLSVLQRISHLDAQPGNKSLSKLKDDKLHERNAVKQPDFTTPVPPFVFTSLSNEVFHPLQIKAPAGKRQKVKELDDE